METVRDLEELRLSRGLSLSQTPVGRTNLSKVENGKQRPGPGLIRKLAKVYGCTTEQIFSAWEETKRRTELAAIEARAAKPAPQSEAS